MRDNLSSPPGMFLFGLMVALLVALLPMPYAYYQLLRLATCALTGWAAYAAWARGSPASAAIWGLIALAYNPLIPLFMTRGHWSALNVGTATVILAAIWYRGARAYLDRPPPFMADTDRLDHQPEDRSTGDAIRRIVPGSGNRPH